MRTVLAILLSSLTVLALPAGGQEPTPKAEPPAADAARESSDSAIAKTEPVPVEAEKAFVPPDGWRPKKRGKFTVYCRKEYNAKGTRFPTETCYDEAGIRAMVAAQLEDREKVDQLRRICAGDTSCGSR